MKKKPAEQTEKSQDNIGYENTETSNDSDVKELNRTQATNTGHGEGPKENKNDTEGLRWESGKKSLGKKSGNNEVG